MLSYIPADLVYMDVPKITVGIPAANIFNPLIWLAFIQMSGDMEISCDEEVLSEKKETAVDYGILLLSVAANRPFWQRVHSPRRDGY
ncbi:MAG: M56 family metallopeptidase [Oscillospiraceae bacterium]